MLCTSCRFRCRSLPPGDSHGAAQDAGLGSWATGPPCQANAWAPAQGWRGCLELSFQGNCCVPRRGTGSLERARKHSARGVSSLSSLCICWWRLGRGSRWFSVPSLRFPLGDALARGLRSWGAWCPEGEGWPPADTEGARGDPEPACPVSASWPGRSKLLGPLMCHPSTSSPAGPCVRRLLPTGRVLSQRSGQHSGLAEMSVGVFYVFMQFYISVDFRKPVKFHVLNG